MFIMFLMEKWAFHARHRGLSSVAVVRNVPLSRPSSACEIRGDRRQRGFMPSSMGQELWI